MLAIVIAHIQFLTPADRIGLQKLIGPGIIASAVDDDVLGTSDSARIGSGRLVAVWIGIGINNNAGDMHVTATDLSGDIAPKILCCNDLDRSAVASRRRECGATGDKS